MSGKNTSGGQVGTSTAAVNVSFVDDLVGEVLLFKQFSATGVTAAVNTPSGVGQAIVNSASTGTPTTATVVVQGSNDNGNSWTNLPNSAQPPGAPRYSQVRLSATISGGTSPTLTVAALVIP